MISRDVALILIGVGAILFIVGWALVFANYGVEIQTCSTYVSTPRSFEGSFSLVENYTRYRALNVASVKDLSIPAQQVYRYRFELNTTAIAPFFAYYNVVSPSSGISSYVLLKDSKNLTLDYIAIQSSTNNVSSSKLLNLNSLNPGEYYLEFTSLTDITIASLNITALSYFTTPAVRITFTPTSFNQVQVNYVCGVSFRGLIVAATIIGFGMAITSFASVYLYRQTQATAKTVPPPKGRGKTLKKK